MALLVSGRDSKDNNFKIPNQVAFPIYNSYLVFEVSILYFRK